MPPRGCPVLVGRSMRSAPFACPAGGPRHFGV